MDIVVADIGGTNARFALAKVDGGQVVELQEPVVLAAAAHAGIAEAWKAFAAHIGVTLPKRASIGLAGPVTGGPVRFVNSHWVVDPATVGAELGLDDVMLMNDFGAMAHAVHAMPATHVRHLYGPDVRLPAEGAISVIGAGTGLGVAILRRSAASVTVLETEGAHVHFAALDDEEALVSQSIRSRHGRASIERVVSGPGLGEIVRSQDAADGRDDASIWADAIAGADMGSAHALDLWIRCYGSAVGDLSLAHGSLGVALVGGLSCRLANRLGGGQFYQRFCDKGRYQHRMESIPVKLVTHPQAGLFGAAAAFALKAS